MLGTKDMQDKKVNPLVLIIKAIRTVQNSTYYNSYSISLAFNKETREIAGVGLSTLPPRCFETIEEEQAKKYDSFASFTHGGGVWLDDGSVIPLNDEITHFLRELIVSFINDPSTHRPKNAEGQWLPMKQKEKSK